MTVSLACASGLCQRHVSPARTFRFSPHGGATMPSDRFGLFAIASLLLLAAPLPAQTQFTFRDVSREAGLLPHVGGIAGHAAAWGDIDNSGYPSLFVGAFGGKPYDSKD